MFWWDYLFLYPEETSILAIILGGGYYLHYELSKLWYKPIHCTDYGKWRIHRYTGRLVDMDGRKFKIRRTFGLNPLFTKEVDGREFKGMIKIPGQPKRKLILHSSDIVEVEWRKIVMNKKYLVWLPEIQAYKFTNVRPTAYQLNPHNLEKFFVYKLDSIDLKANKAAIAAPQVIHNSLLQQHLPLEFGEYEEALDEQLSETTKFMFNNKEVGNYKLVDEIIEEERIRDLDNDDSEIVNAEDE